MNKITKNLISLLLVTLAVLAPVSALSVSADNTNTNIVSGTVSVILEETQVTSDNGQVEFTLTTYNSVMDGATTPAPVDFVVEIQLSGDGINGVTTKTIELLGDGTLAQTQTQTVSFILDQNLAEGSYSLNADLTILTQATTPVIVDTASTGTNPITLVVEPAVPTNMEPNLITANLDEDNLNPGDVVEIEIDLENGATDYEDVNVEARILDSNNERIGDKVEANTGHLESNDDETVTMSMTLPSDLDEGIYTVEIVVTGDVESGAVMYMNTQLDSETLSFDVERHKHSLTIDSVQHN